MICHWRMTHWCLLEQGVIGSRIPDCRFLRWVCGNHDDALNALAKPGHEWKYDGKRFRQVPIKEVTDD